MSYYINYIIYYITNKLIIETKNLIKLSCFIHIFSDMYTKKFGAFHRHELNCLPISLRIPIRFFSIRKF